MKNKWSVLYVAVLVLVVGAVVWVKTRKPAPATDGPEISAEAQGGTGAHSTPAAAPVTAGGTARAASVATPKPGPTLVPRDLGAVVPTGRSSVVGVNPVPVAEAHLPSAVPGQRVLARLNVRGQLMEFKPNQVGSFPRVNLDPGQQVSVVVQWPDAQAGQRVVAAVEDGGTLNDGKRVLPLDLDGARSASFEFTADRGPGIYRVTVRSGPDARTLEFWVAPELAAREQ